MRISTLSFLALIVTAKPALAQGANLLSPTPGLIVWTLITFTILFIVLWKFAFPQLISAVEAREKALEEAIASAARDRDEASKLLAEQKRQLDASRAEGDRFIQEGRSAGEKVRSTMIEETRLQQQEMLERARREIENEKERAIKEMRREAVDLALAGASKIIETNLDDAQNRKLVESYLSSIAAGAGR